MGVNKLSSYIVYLILYFHVESNNLTPLKSCQSLVVVDFFNLNAEAVTTMVNIEEDLIVSLQY